jgi:hypothetical protein
MKMCIGVMLELHDRATSWEPALAPTKPKRRKHAQPHGSVDRRQVSGDVDTRGCACFSQYSSRSYRYPNLKLLWS